MYHLGWWRHFNFMQNERKAQKLLLGDLLMLLLLSFSHLVVPDSVRHHGLQHTRLLCPSPSPRICSNSGPLSQWCHPTISSSVVPFFYYPLFFPASGSFPMSRLFTSGSQSIAASASVLPMNIWFPLGWTVLISLLSKGLSRVISSTTVLKHQFFDAQPSLQSNPLWKLTLQHAKNPVLRLTVFTEAHQRTSAPDEGWGLRAVWEPINNDNHLCISFFSGSGWVQAGVLELVWFLGSKFLKLPQLDLLNPDLLPHSYCSFWDWLDPLEGNINTRVGRVSCHLIEVLLQSFPSSPVVKTLPSKCRMWRFIAWSRS